MKSMLSTFAVIGLLCSTGSAFADLAPPSGAKASRCDRQLVMQIDSGKITSGPGGYAIAAFGVAESAGWSFPTLILSGPPEDGVATVDFVACRPEISAQVLTPIQSKETLNLGPSINKIIIRTKTNTMTVDITH